jgi:hypothetical protein
MGKKRNANKISTKILKGRDDLGELRVDMRVVRETGREVTG